MILLQMRKPRLRLRVDNHQTEHVTQATNHNNLPSIRLYPGIVKRPYSDVLKELIENAVVAFNGVNIYVFVVAVQPFAL